jgi:hypothetical protein
MKATTEMESGNDVAMTFTVHASRGDEITTTVRLNVIAAIAKGRTLIDKGWQVFITDTDGNRISPVRFRQTGVVRTSGRPEYATSGIIHKKYIFLGERHMLSLNEASVVQFLVEPFTVLGFQGQYWMLIVVAMIAAYILFAWKTGNRK